MPRLSQLTRTYRHLQRYREIAGVLLKQGFYDLLMQLELRGYLNWRLRRRLAAPPPENQLSRYARVRLVFEELGPAFIKLGQMLSTRRDILPPALIVELEKLQDLVPPFPGETARQIVEAELGEPVSVLFSEFQLEALASASIAQVHAACTRTGERVVVKVQRPDIRKVIETDLELMAHIASLMERSIEGADAFQPTRIVREFARTIRRELDFQAEAGSISRFAINFAEDQRIHVPKVYARLSTDKILTLEQVEGLKISQVDQFQARGLDPKTVADRGASLVMEQIFKHGFFHADPHPGNLRVLPGNVLCFLDFGIIGMLAQRRREELTRMLEGVVIQDEHRIAMSVFRLTNYNHFENTDAIESEIANFMQEHLSRPLGEIRIGAVLNDLARILFTYGIYFPSDFFLLTKAVTLLEGVGRRLAPDFDVIEHMKPFVKNRLRRGWSAREFYVTASFLLNEMQMLVRDLPSEMREILNLLKRGEVRVKLEHRGLEDFIQSNDRISNRITFGIVLAALIVGSSIMVLSNIPPTWNEIPVIGLAGFVISGILGFRLLVAMLHHGRF